MYEQKQIKPDFKNYCKLKADIWFLLVLLEPDYQWFMETSQIIYTAYLI